MSEVMLYSPIHKGIRNWLFRISADAARLDFTDDEAAGKFREDFASLVHNITRHHELEKDFIHPLLADRVPGGAEKLEEDHRVVTHLMDNLVKHLNGIIALPDEYEKKREQGLEFYLAYNRFINFFMEHLNEEEQHTQRTLWHLCGKGELVATVGKLMASQEPALAMENMTMIITSVSLDELAAIVLQAKPGVPEQAFQGLLSLAERNLSAVDYVGFLSRIGIK